MNLAPGGVTEMSPGVTRWVVGSVCASASPFSYGPETISPDLPGDIDQKAWDLGEVNGGVTEITAGDSPVVCVNTKSNTAAAENQAEQEVAQLLNQELGSHRRGVLVVGHE